ncbi:hypothetical protein BSL78_06732 [Apostichopus japonicus]|uniref:G-protein coupled receptor n=1 Tax=Stichopus japonicus TaxID=307972 RepID=A0A2G8L7W6_STIJA|nr:hypothetical protein BSL78_06732 [Apostichopus japonicus]
MTTGDITGATSSKIVVSVTPEISTTDTVTDVPFTTPVLLTLTQCTELPYRPSSLLPATDVPFLSCPSENISYSGVHLTFEDTVPGKNVNSSETCDDDSSSPDQPLATRKCVDNGWEDPTLTTCFTCADEASQEIERITNTDISEDNVEEVANDLAIVTTQSECLDTTAINNVAISLESIAEVNSSSPEVTQSVVGTVSNLMEIGEDQLEQAEDTASVISSLDQQVSNKQKQSDNFTDVQENVGVTAVKFDPTITSGVTFLYLPSSNIPKEELLTADFKQENTRLFIDENEVYINTSTASIFIPKGILDLAQKHDPSISQIPISFSIFKDARLFMTEQSLDTGRPRAGSVQREVFASQVISAKLELDGLVVESLEEEDHIVTRFIVDANLGSNEILLEKKCVSWNPPEGSIEGKWSENDCNTSEVDKHIVCNCNNLYSHFGVLVGAGVDRFSLAMNTTIEVVTVTGSCLSIVGLSVTLVPLTILKDLRQKQGSWIYTNLCLCLLAFNTIFLAGTTAKDDESRCENIAAAMHYFSLASVGWITAEAVNMYLLFVKYDKEDPDDQDDQDDKDDQDDQDDQDDRGKVHYFVPVSACFVYGKRSLLEDII